jgi:hypothetical protein
MMKITRVYLNSSDDAIRVDEVTVDVNFPPAVIDPRLLSDKGLMMVTGPQRIKTERIFVSGASRDVDAIQVVGDIDDIEESTGSFAWASKTLGNGQVIFFDMLSLPVIGDTV